jgi:hypothetical protein
MPKIILIGDPQNVSNLHKLEVIKIKATHPWLQFKKIRSIVKKTDIVIWKIQYNWELLDKFNNIHPKNGKYSEIYDILFRNEYIKFYIDFLVNEIKLYCDNVFVSFK